MRRFAITLSVLFATAALLAFAGYRNARADPIVRRAPIALPNWPAGAPPIRVVLASDVHVGSPAMGPARLAAIVDQVNALDPDLVLLAGDFIAGHERRDAAREAAGLMAFARLRPRLGTIAVLGNHDHWTDAALVKRTLAAAGVRVLENEAVARGPIAIGGVGDAFTRHDRLAPTLVALRRLPGARIVLTHSPDVAPALPADIAVLLAGHTHCGQIVLPLIGAPWVPSRYGRRYLCGVIREGARTVVVTGGLGTSMMPLRFGAPPDIWLLTLGGPA